MARKEACWRGTGSGGTGDSNGGVGIRRSGCARRWTNETKAHRRGNGRAWRSFLDGWRVDRAGLLQDPRLRFLHTRVGTISVPQEKSAGHRTRSRGGDISGAHERRGLGETGKRRGQRGDYDSGRVLRELSLFGCQGEGVCLGGSLCRVAALQLDVASALFLSLFPYDEERRGACGRFGRRSWLRDAGWCWLVLLMYGAACAGVESR